jgi:hypothetical protein
MIELTKARLAGAQSLLTKLQNEQFRQVQQASPTASSEFFSLLNSFITAARSVRWVLQSEEKEKYDAWSASWQASLSDDEKEIFSLMTDMRNSIEKLGHAGIEARREQVTIPDNPDPFSGTQHFNLPEWGRPTTMIDVYYVKGTDREVLSVCKQYVAILTRLINDFEQQHV